MTFSSGFSAATRIAKLIMFNVFGILFFWWLVIDDPRRKPILVVLIPALLLIDFLLVRRMFGKEAGASISLPIIYLCGLAYGVWWLAHGFVWWKALLLVIPLSLLIMSIQRLTRGERSKSE